MQRETAQVQNPIAPQTTQDEAKAVNGFPPGKWFGVLIKSQVFTSAKLR